VQNGDQAVDYAVSTGRSPGWLEERSLCETHETF
jgi:hypothetical protein